MLRANFIAKQNVCTQRNSNEWMFNKQVGLHVHIELAAVNPMPIPSKCVRNELFYCTLYTLTWDFVWIHSLSCSDVYLCVCVFLLCEVKSCEVRIIVSLSLSLCNNKCNSDTFQRHSLNEFYCLNYLWKLIHLNWSHIYHHANLALPSSIWIWTFQMMIKKTFSINFQ